ncbi:MAG: tetratricopeptide repeat protein [Geothrix sp.]|nr:tetratricopeptide repeat protein [Geothrix sp.]
MERQLVLAGCLLEQGDLGGARAALEQVLAWDPGHLVAHETLVQVHLGAGDPARAHKEQTRRALFLDGRSGPAADCVWAHATLLYGEMPLGWDLYEARLAAPGLTMPERHFTHPRWNGESFPGKTLLLHYEQGLGDTLMFVRFAPRVKALGGRVLLAAQRPLADLVATCPGIDEVIPKGGPVPPFDCHFPLLSLPWLFRTELASIPAEVPYLRVPPHVPNRQALCERLALGAGRLRVGLAWKGSSDHPRDAQRSVPPACLTPLAKLPGVAWYSFQREGGLPEPFPGILALGPLLSTFSDTAFALEAMDLLITVDTAVAHLAGALGIPTLLLVTNIPDWRWLMDRDDSPWYPTLRIYRQPLPGDWDSVVQHVLADLMSPG